MKIIQKTQKKLAGSRKARFGLVGAFNTMVDFVVLNILVSVVGVPLVLSNIASTTTAMCVSFILNKKAVFRDDDEHKIRQLIIFFAVTLTGIWAVQGAVMYGAYQILDALTGWHAGLLLNLAKIAGISVGLIWNYVWYSKVVFRKRQV